MELHYGNLIEKAKNGEFDVIIHGCNCFHTMGAGIARHIKTNFPEAYEADKTTPYGDKNKLGSFSEVLIESNGHNLVVINAYTQWRYGAGEDHFDYKSFPTLLQSIKAKYGDKSIGIPLIGCGLAGGDEARILSMIKENFEGVDYKLVEIDINRKLNLLTEEKKEEVIAFTKVSSPYGWLGNMAPYPIVYNSIKYLTTEALFQSLRFNNHPDIQKEIIEQKSPMNAKTIAKKYKGLLEKEGFELLGKQDVDNMVLCIKLKLEQYPELKQQLIDTKSSLIIEDCSSRPMGSGLFWGAQKIENDWKGENVLGKIWMDYRKKLQNNQNLTVDNKEIKKEYTYFFHLTSPFSNFHPSKFEYKDLTFISNEQFMMYSKAKTFNDEDTANKIIALNNTPIAKQFLIGQLSSEQIVNNKDLSKQWNQLMMDVKKLGRGVKNYNDDMWIDKRVKVVFFGAKLKFTQNVDLKKILLDTGDNFMIESSPYDKIWGIGLSESDAKKTKPENWPGQNLLGKVLDEVKFKLKNENIPKDKMKM